MASVLLLDVTPEAERLTNAVLKSGLLPPSADADAAHIALATVHRMDILLTWNCRHIANAEIEVRLRRHVLQWDTSCPRFVHPKGFSVKFMNDSTIEPSTRNTDEVLQEIWRIKDELSAARGHDVHRLFAEARERQNKSGRRIVSFQETPSPLPEGE